MSSSIQFSARAVLGCSLLALLPACGSDSDDSGFSLSTTSTAASPAAPIVVAGDWIVYFASEGFTGPAGTNLNDNGTDVDTADQVAFAVSTRARTETNLGVAALAAVILGDQIFLVVDEALDGIDWDGGGVTGIVLLHWSQVAGVVTLVDTLPSAGDVPRAVDGRLYYAGDTIPAVADATNLNYVTAAAPTTIVNVLNQAGGGTLEVHILGEDAELLFLTSDESAAPLDQNGDGDATDTHVLALLDATDAAARVKSVELALAGPASPFAARVLGTSDWLVAFLVDEAAQGATNLNDQALFAQPLLPENCLGTPDADATDRVLHFLDFSSFLTGATQPVNAGLAGHTRVLILDGSPNDFVATISDEVESNCNLNAGTGDTDTGDDVARWVEAVTPIAPARDAEDLHALATATPGGSSGLSVLDDRLIGVIDEAADDANHDGKANDHELVAWIDPDVTNPTWVFSHQSASNRGFGTGVFDSDDDSEPFAGTSWMAPESVGGRLGITFLEEVPGTNANVGSLNTNLDCNLVAKDADKVDGLPVWADFESGPTLDFDGVGYSIDEANAGIEIAGAFAFFRVAEADDNRDYNADGQLNDVVLFRNPLTTCGPVAMATSSLIQGQVIATDRVSGAAFLSSESQAGVDFNADGDTTDLVVRYFRF